VRGFRLTARARLTLLYTGMFTLCGAILVAVSYLLVASLPEAVTDSSTIVMENPSEFLAICRHAINTDNPELRFKCDKAFQEGMVAGAHGQREATLAHLLQYSVITLAAATALAALAGWFIAGRVLRPVHQITAAARSASQHNLSARVALTGPRDELRDLADTFDDMLARLEAAFQSQKRFIANASHELRTPLTVMRTAVDVVLAKPAATPDELLAMGREVRTAVEQADRLIDALLTLARNEHGLHTREHTDLATVAEDAVDAAAVGDRGVHLDLRPAPLSGDPVLLERLAANLIDNAVRYNVSGGDVWVTTGMRGGRATLTVANTGPPIDPAAVDGLFQPFHRLENRTTRDGFGLGLAIVASIAAVHHGTVTARPRAAGGLALTVSIPATETPRRASPTFRQNPRA